MKKETGNHNRKMRIHHRKMFHGLCNKNVKEKNWIVNSTTAKINIFPRFSLYLTVYMFTINNQDCCCY